MNELEERVKNNPAEIIKIFGRQYSLIEKRMVELSDYVTISNKNYSTFSNQFISMYLTICSEADSLADELCALLGISSKERYGINNKINNILERYDNLRNWRCITKFPFDELNIVPFAKFQGTESADWWKDYNKVKHSRIEKNDNNMYNYERANLKNVLYSLAALYLLISKVKMEFCTLSPIEIKSDVFDVVFL
ncbi:MAG: hypothetical protein J6A37_02050 [Oscillospiraceae bacterium]|nr:hypothetical protein [Oscillospiraceae bacterium]